MKHINPSRFVLATDLDGTFLETSGAENDPLYRLINEQREDTTLIFVTGRNIELILPILDDPFIPRPDYIISDVGASVLCGKTLEPIQPLHSQSCQSWQKALTNIEDLLPEMDVFMRQPIPHERRLSYYIPPEDMPHDLISRLQSRECDTIYSRDDEHDYLDILAKGTNKGKTLLKLIEHLGFDQSKVLVAGDTMNDHSLFETGLNGVVLANAERALKKNVAEAPNIHFSQLPGTQGIFEALMHFDLTPEKNHEITKPVYGQSDLVMVYHRLPYREVEENGKRVSKPHTSPNGIIPTLLGFFSEQQKGSWVAWSLSDTRTPTNFDEHVYVDRDKYENLQVCRVPLTKKDVEIFYEVFSKEAFWLLLHCFHERAVFNHDHWEHYVEINRIFAEKAAQEASHGATIWIHDYNLWMVPAALRQLRPDVKIAFYHHTPFPPADVFNIIPWRREIIASLLQCDYVGFHIPQYVENFVQVVRSNYATTINDVKDAAPHFKVYGCAIGASSYVTSLSTDLGTVHLGAHPVGINCEYISGLAKSPRVQELCEQINAELQDRHLIVSIERTDYTKGPIEKLQAYARFLEKYPDMRGKAALIMVCTPPAKGMKIYEEITQDIAYHVGLINGKYGTYNWTPIRFFSRAIPFEDVIAYYKAADVGWITPLRDGLNLVAKEYVLTKDETNTPGVLVLSEFAGAAAELFGAMLTNPYDIEDMANTLYKAVNMGDQEKRLKTRRAANIVRNYDVHKWGEDFLSHVQASGRAQQETQKKRA